MKQTELPHEMIAIHRNYFEYLKRQKQENRARDYRIGEFLWFIVSGRRTQSEIVDKLVELFPAWQHQRDHGKWKTEKLIITQTINVLRPRNKV
jgi:hypothetical protein